MSVPKKRQTSAKSRRRASHFALSKKNLVICPKCKKEILPHRACPYCGTYANKQVLAISTKKKKTKKKEK